MSLLGEVCTVGQIHQQILTWVRPTLPPVKPRFWKRLAPEVKQDQWCLARNGIMKSITIKDHVIYKILPKMKKEWFIIQMKCWCPGIVGRWSKVGKWKLVTPSPPPPPPLAPYVTTMLPPQPPPPIAPDLYTALPSLSLEIWLAGEKT